MFIAAKAWIYDVVGDIRRILGKKKITMPDFLKVMPDHVRSSPSSSETCVHVQQSELLVVHVLRS